VRLAAGRSGGAFRAVGGGAPGERAGRRGGLDRNELGALLVAAGLGPPAGHALLSLLALNGLRTRKSGKVVTIPLAPRTAGDRPGHRRGR
jgi:hypothetical protein